ncbi:YhcN/YlaJ family sporulation lipoprotein [Ectobacillus sp. sgz5001026]|uniref:YhcN/YlaJ family sporulation lipoprotein n=1 Tax=Ectobacillus sp. sgz5001026 TaxID=3242473 RepID=UPI0036D21BA9
MHKKVKQVAATLLLVGTLTACSTSQSKTSMEQQTGYEQTSYRGQSYYPNVQGNIPYTNVTNASINQTAVPNYGNVKYSKINQHIHNKRNSVAYDYHTDPTSQAHFYNAYPKRNITMNGYDSAKDRKLAEDLTQRINRMNEVEKGVTIVKGNDVIVAIRPRVKGEEKKAEDAVSKEISPITNGRHVRITSDEATFNKAQSMSIHLLRGTMTPSMKTEMDSMFQSNRPNVM